MTVSKNRFKQLSRILGLILFFILGFWLGTKYHKNQDSVTIINSVQELEEFQSITGEFVRTWLAGDAEACANNFAENAVYMVPGEPTLFGRIAIKASLEKLFDNRGNQKIIKMMEPAKEVITFQNWAVIRGIGEESIMGMDSVVEKESYKWMVVAKRKDDGKWETVWDIYNLDN